MTNTINTPETLLAAACRTLDIIDTFGIKELPERDEERKWRRVDYVSCTSKDGWASTVVPDSDAVAEAIIEDTDTSVTVILRSYRRDDDSLKRVARWYIGSRSVSRAEAREALAEEDAIKAALEEPLQVAEEQNLNQLIRDGLHGREVSFEEWDALRRTMYEDREDWVEVQHGEYETHLFLKGQSGITVATWWTSTGTCSITAPHKAADQIAQSLGNYIKNGLRYGWGRIDE